jgi:hypothetical protein
MLLIHHAEVTMWAGAPEFRLTARFEIDISPTLDLI